MSGSYISRDLCCALREESVCSSPLGLLKLIVELRSDPPTFDPALLEFSSDLVVALPGTGIGGRLDELLDGSLSL